MVKPTSSSWSTRHRPRLRRTSSARSVMSTAWRSTWTSWPTIPRSVSRRSSAAAERTSTCRTSPTCRSSGTPSSPSRRTQQTTPPASCRPLSSLLTTTCSWRTGGGILSPRSSSSSRLTSWWSRVTMPTWSTLPGGYNQMVSEFFCHDYWWQIASLHVSQMYSGNSPEISHTMNQMT